MMVCFCRVVWVDYMQQCTYCTLYTAPPSPARGGKQARTAETHVHFKIPEITCRGHLSLLKTHNFKITGTIYPKSYTYWLFTNFYVYFIIMKNCYYHKCQIVRKIQTFWGSRWEDSKGHIVHLNAIPFKNDWSTEEGISNWAWISTEVP